MSEHYHDIFYQTEELSVETKRKILDIAFEKSYTWWVDVLDITKDWRRTTVNDIPYPEILKKLTGDSHFICIHRRGYEHNGSNQKWFGEVGFVSTENRIDYFLWINITETDFNNIVSTFNLSILT
jgi:hypothetical protein